MNTLAAPTVTLTDDELQIVGGRIGITEFPVVLAIRPRQPTVDAWEQARELATRHLAARGLIDRTGIAADLTDMVGALRRPARQLAIRLVTPDGLARICIAQTSAGIVVARRIGNSVQLRLIAERTAPAKAALAELPAAEPAAVDAFGAPVAELVAALDGGHDAMFLTDRLRTLGAPPQTALAIGSALAARVAFAEIVCHAVDPVSDQLIRVPGTVAVLYTKRGRVVSAPSRSPSGQLWTTIKPGSDHRVMQAISQLVELTPGGWEGDAR